MPSPPRDRAPEIRAAGKKGIPDVGVNGAMMTMPAPPTPDNLKPYRLSHTGQIGYQSMMSPARAKDPQIPSNTVFGDVNDYSDNAAKCLSVGKPFAMGEKIHRYKSEKAEPLGKPRQYEYSLPAGSDNKVWGKVIDKSESAKGIMYPSNHTASHSNPKKEPGYQADRNYNWNGTSLNEVRFGRQGPGLEANFKNLGQSVETTVLVPSPTKAAREAKRSPTGSTLIGGTAPSTAYDGSKSFGKTTAKDTARDNVNYLMHGGDVPPKDDETLGTFNYTSPRVRRQKAEDRKKVDEGRSFGIPTVRTDKRAPEPHQVKVTSGVGYAGDADAGALLYQGDRSTVYNKGLSVAQCVEMNEKCSFGLTEDQIHRAHAHAARKGDVTAGAFSMAISDLGF